MEINYSISPYPSLLQNMVARVYETAAPNAEIQNIVLATPHTNPRNISFTGLDRVPHIVRLFTLSGTLLHSYDVQPTANIVTIFDPIFFKIGDGGAKTPVAGTALYANADLAGLTNTGLVITRDGIAQYPGRHYDVDITGGFHLLVNGDQFEDTVEWVIQRKPQALVNPINDSVVGKQFGGFVTVNNVPINYIPAHLRKLIMLSGANGQYYFPAGTAIPIGYTFRFENHGAYTAITDTATIFFNNAPLLMGNSTVTLFALPYRNIAEFTFNGTNWICTMDCRLTTQNPPAAFISYIGTYRIGDVVSNNDVRTISIPLQSDLNYTVIGSLRSSNSNLGNDNNVSVIIGLKGLSSFMISTREYVRNIQTLDFDYILIRS